MFAILELLELGLKGSSRRYVVLAGTAHTVTLIPFARGGVGAGVGVAEGVAVGIAVGATVTMVFVLFAPPSAFVTLLLEMFELFAVCEMVFICFAISIAVPLLELLTIKAVIFWSDKFADALIPRLV